MKCTENIRKQAKRVWLWLLRKDILIYGLFVGLAFIFWWGRAMSSPRDVVIQVPLVYQQISDQIVLTQTLPSTINIKIRDNGKQLRQIKKQNIHLHLDIAPYIKAEKGNITISTDILKHKLQDLLPGSTAIQQINPEVIASAYYIQQQKTVPVAVISQLTVAPQHQLIGRPRVTPSHVNIYGVQEQIDTIEQILTDSVRVTDLRDSITMTIPLKTTTNVRVHPSQVCVTWYAEQFTEKTFTLPIKPQGIPVGKRLRTFPTTIDVVVRVGISHFAQVTANDLKAVCYYPTKPYETLPIEIITNNPHISNIRFSPHQVEYIVEM